MLLEVVLEQVIVVLVAMAVMVVVEMHLNQILGKMDF
tara:strand:+ start:380 stop:490 length:111 start_codon:yes stop_codon:yes gene_type:complete